MDILLRFGIALAVLALILALVAVARRLFEGRTRHTVARLNAQGKHRGGPARILYFTSERCVQCKTRQEPALRSLLADAPEPVALEHFDAARDREAASTYRILTAPSTVVIGRDGRVAAINHGFAPAERIASQLGWVSSASAAMSPSH
jgi:hypothetical protein